MTRRQKATPIDPRGQEWVSLQEAAALYCISVDTVRRRISSGDLPASRCGRRIVRVRVDDLDRLFRPIPVGRRSAQNNPSWAS